MERVSVSSGRATSLRVQVETLFLPSGGLFGLLPLCPLDFLHCPAEQCNHLELGREVSRKENKQHDLINVISNI